MSKVITIKDPKDDSVVYTLGYSRDIVRNMERAGFKQDGISDTPATSIPMLFHGAFLLNHQRVSQHIIDDLWARIPDKPGFISALVALYNEPLDAMLDEPDKKSGEVKWEMN